MKIKLLIVLTVILYSCGNKKVLQLPEINYSKITKLNDVSAAYLFFNETQKDSVELNRKNLISTTNWLINVDKRLTLKQVIPHIQFLQEKKKNSSHKNEVSKNYFTCNDTNKKNLGFIDFSEIVYHEEVFDRYVLNNSTLDFSNKMKIEFYSSEEIYTDFPIYDSSSFVSKKSSFINDIKLVLSNEPDLVEIILSFNQNLTFQDYISYKSLLLNSDLKNVTIAHDEFIFN